VHFGSGQQVGSTGRAGLGWAGAHQQAGLEPNPRRTTIHPDRPAAQVASAKKKKRLPRRFG